MSYVRIRREVGDYAEWKPYFDDLRIEYGQQSYQLFRSSENPNDIVMIDEFEDEDRVREFVEMDELRETMTEAGVKGKPGITFFDLAEEKSVPQPSA